jgi:hypothetical protein
MVFTFGNVFASTMAARRVTIPAAFFKVNAGRFLIGKLLKEFKQA